MLLLLAIISLNGELMDGSVRYEVEGRKYVVESGYVRWHVSPGTLQHVRKPEPVTSVQGTVVSVEGEDIIFIGSFEDE